MTNTEKLPRVMAIISKVNEPSTFILAKNSPAREEVISSSAVIQATLILAFTTGAKVKIELVPESNVIKRIHPFESQGRSHHTGHGDYLVSRIATQRASDGSDYSEVFLKKYNGKNDKAYNVKDLMLQQLLMSSISTSANEPFELFVKFEKGDISTVQLGWM